MQEGLSFNMFLSGATLVSVLTLIFQVWRSSRAITVKQPVQVEAGAMPTETKLCDERHKKNDEEHYNLFCRLAALERRDGRVEGEITQINSKMTAIESKVDLLIKEIASQ